MIERAFIAVCDSCRDESEPLLWKYQVKRGSSREAKAALPAMGWAVEGRKVDRPLCADPDDRL